MPETMREILRLRFIPLRFAPLHSAPLRMTCWFFLLVLCFVSDAVAQKKETINYFRSPYKWAVQIDPVGYLLGRYGARLEMRSDPNFSYYLDGYHDRDIDTFKTSITNNRIPVNSIGIGWRIYLKDNNAPEGLFGGVAVGPTIQSGSRLGLRLSAEIGYKWMLGDGPFFIEPQLLIDAYPLRDRLAKAAFTYVAVPLGFAWK
jgi:hypothetical protein